PRLRHRKEQVPDRRLSGDTSGIRLPRVNAVAVRLGPDGAYELPHHTEPTAEGDRPRLRRDVSRDQPEQRRLARAIGPNQRSRRPLTHPERGVVDQHPPVRKRVTHMSHLDMPHFESIFRWAPDQFRYRPRPYLTGRGQLRQRINRGGRDSWGWWG